MTMKCEKFLFDCSFEPQDMREREQSVTPAALKEALEQSYREGFKEGQRSAQADIDAQNTAHLETLIRFLEKEELTWQGIRQSFAHTLKESLGILLPALAEKNGFEEVLKSLDAILDDTPYHQEITLELSPRGLAALDTKINQVPALKKINFTLQASDDLGPVDCRVSWDGGGMERLSKRILHDLYACLDRLALQETLLPAHGDAINHKGDK